MNINQSLIFYDKSNIKASGFQKDNLVFFAILTDIFLTCLVVIDAYYKKCFDGVSNGLL